MMLGHKEFFRRLKVTREGFRLMLKAGRLPKPQRIGDGFLVDWSEEYLRACQDALLREKRHNPKAMRLRRLRRRILVRERGIA